MPLPGLALFAVAALTTAAAPSKSRVDCEARWRQLTARLGTREGTTCFKDELADRTCRALEGLGSTVGGLPAELERRDVAACTAGFLRRCLDGSADHCGLLGESDASAAELTARCMKGAGPWCAPAFRGQHELVEQLCENGRSDACIAILREPYRWADQPERAKHFLNGPKEVRVFARERLKPLCPEKSACRAEADAALFALQAPFEVSDADVAKARARCAGRPSAALCEPLLDQLLLRPGESRVAIAADTLWKPLPTSPAAEFAALRARCAGGELVSCRSAASYLSKKAENQPAADLAAELAVRERACSLSPPGGSGECMGLGWFRLRSAQGLADIEAAAAAFKIECEAAKAYDAGNLACTEHEKISAAAKACAGTPARCVAAAELLPYRSETGRTLRQTLAARGCQAGSSADCDEVLAMMLDSTSPPPVAELKKAAARASKSPSAEELKANVGYRAACEAGEPRSCVDAAFGSSPQVGTEGAEVAARARLAARWLDAACARGDHEACLEPLKHLEYIRLMPPPAELVLPRLRPLCESNPQLCGEYLERPLVELDMLCALCGKAPPSPVCEEATKTCPKPVK